jgi:hypothetical protein
MIDNIDQMNYYHNLYKFDEEMYYLKILIKDKDRFLLMNNHLISNHMLHLLLELILIVLYLIKEKKKIINFDLRKKNQNLRELSL